MGDNLLDKVTLGEVHSQRLGNLIQDDGESNSSLNPIKAGSEMKLATAPNRSNDATKRIPPTRQASPAVAPISEASVAPGVACWIAAGQYSE